MADRDGMGEVGPATREFIERVLAMPEMVQTPRPVRAALVVLHQLPTWSRLSDERQVWLSDLADVAYGHERRSGESTERQRTRLHSGLKTLAESTNFEGVATGGWREVAMTFEPGDFRLEPLESPTGVVGQSSESPTGVPPEAPRESLESPTGVVWPIHKTTPVSTPESEREVTARSLGWVTRQKAEWPGELEQLSFDHGEQPVTEALSAIEQEARPKEPRFRFASHLTAAVEEHIKVAGTDEMLADYRNHKPPNRCDTCKGHGQTMANDIVDNSVGYITCPDCDGTSATVEQTS
jgi:hypothetical protein